MKRYTISILLLSSLSLKLFSQTFQETAYSLEIKKGKVITVNGKKSWEILVTLTNNAADTLKYFSMSCSWQDFYSVDNKYLTIETPECDKNIPVILSLPPNMCRREHLRLFTDQPKANILFKIGLNIIQANGSPLDFDPREERKKKNVTWSNSIEW